MCNFSMLIHGKFSLKITRRNTLTKIMAPTIEQCWASVYLIDVLTLVQHCGQYWPFFHPLASSVREILSTSMYVCLSTRQWKPDNRLFYSKSKSRSSGVTGTKPYLPNYDNNNFVNQYNQMIYEMI